MQRIVITGANRGIGLEFAHQFLHAGNFVVGTCRSEADVRDLKRVLSDIDSDNGQVLVTPLDVGDPNSILKAATLVREHVPAVDVLINNAGVNKASGFPPGAVKGPLQELQAEALLACLRTNAVGPAIVTQRFAPLLARSDNPRAIFISSDRGSISQTDTSRSIGYSMSKAALNMLVRKLAIELAEYGIIAVALHPGWVRTELGGTYAALSPAQSVGGMLRVIESLTDSCSGRFFDQAGRDIPW